MANGECPKEALAAPVDGLKNFSAQTRGAVRNSLNPSDIKTPNGNDGIRNLDGIDLNQLFLGEPASGHDLADEKEAIREKSDGEPTIIPTKKLKIGKKLNELDQDDIRSLDLHNHTKDDVASCVRNVIFTGKKHDDEFVLIITGRGNRSEKGPVLRPEVEKQLVGYYQKGVIKKFITAPPKLGGTGAFVVVLR